MLPTLFFTVNFFLVFCCFVCTRYFICLIRRGKVHENCFPFCFCCCCFFLLFFLCSHCCSCCHGTFYFTSFLRILCAMPMSVCFSFSHRILSFIYNNGTRVLASCCYSRFIFFFCLVSPLTYRQYDFICWLLILHDMCLCVSVCARTSFFTRSCTFLCVFIRFVSFFSLFAFLIAAFIP